MSDTSVADPPRKGRVAAPREEKIAVVDEVREKLSSAGAAILTEYRGLKVSELETLRRALRQAGGEYKVYKNTLVRFATRELGLDALEPLLEGPTAIAFADADVPGVAKALRDFSRTNPLLVVKGGVMGSSVLTARDAAALADIPSRDVLLAQLAGLMAAPLRQFAGLLQAMPRNLAYGLKALIDQGGAPGAPAAAEATPEPAPEAAEVAPEPAAEPAEPTEPTSESTPTEGAE
jgi:large subunit ribosomal protein L10